MRTLRDKLYTWHCKHVPEYTEDPRTSARQDGPDDQNVQKKGNFLKKKVTFSREGLEGPRDPRECSKSIPGDVPDLPMLRQLPQLLLRAEIEGFLGRAPVRENGNFCSGEGMWLWQTSENTRKSWKIIKNREKSRKRIPNTVYISLWAHRRVLQITFWDSTR